ncbi:alpha/beta-hydrolase, partial [Mollisia scopiformis]
VPPTTGSYDVGVRSYAIPFIDQHNPSWPGNISTSYLATIYYPTIQTSNKTVTLYVDPEAAAPLDALYNQTSGTVGNLTTNIKPNAAIAEPPQGSLFPSLIFQPGFEGLSAMYSITMTELASRGYAVAALDFPYETTFVRYPNGTGVSGIYGGIFSFDIIPPIYETRIRAGIHFVEYWSTLVEQLHAPFQVAPLGVFGQSLGGAAALGVADAIPDRKVVASALNLDGGLYGNPASNSSLADLKRPVLQMGTVNHTGSYDPTWDTFPVAQTGWWRTLWVARADHLDFSDVTFWREFLVNRQTSNTAIQGRRMVNVTREFVTAFFNYTLLNQEEKVLSKPGADWPEV